MDFGMIHLTRAITAYLTRPDHRLLPGPSSSLCFEQIPLTLWITLAGTPDSESGMLVNLAQIRTTFSDHLTQNTVCFSTAPDLLDYAFVFFTRQFPSFSVASIRVDLHSRLSLSRLQGAAEMILLTTKYEIAASHTLTHPEWNSDQNRDYFGKCANPAGHGHNYLIEITLAGKPDPKTGQILTPDQIQNTVRTFILDPFDHKNLNRDCPEFQSLLPTVENMAKTFYDLLAGKFHPAQLYRVRVWETPHSYADYFGPHAGPLRFSDNL